MIDTSNPSMFENVMRQIMSITDPDERQRKLQELARAYPERMAQIKGMMTQGSDLMGTEMPGMRKGPSGNPFAYSVAANPLEFLSAGLRQYKGGKMMGDANQQMDDELGRMEEGRATFMGAAGQAPTTTQPPNSFYETEEERRRREEAERRFI